MGKAEREWRHQANLARINQVQLLAGIGDGTHVDHEGTVLERARMLVDELASHQATEQGLAAFDRLLRIADEPPSRQQRDVVAFLAAVWNSEPLPLTALRGVERRVGDDMLAVLDAFRYGRLNLAEQVEGGPRRVARVLTPLAPPAYTRKAAAR
jgi:hypothetical protein